jgi:23S rRNA (uracil1939-C5)-methyltransferase
MTTDAREQKTITCTGIGSAGVSVCQSTTEEDKKKIFLHGLIPGEKALVNITKDNSNFLSAELVQIISKSSSRITPECPYFNMCGGCQFQFMSINAERDAKLDMIKGFLSRQYKIDNFELINASLDLPEYRYRRRIILHFSHDGLVGFHRNGTGQVVPIDSCLLAIPEIDKQIKEIKKLSLKLSVYAKAIEISKSEKQVFTLFLRNRVNVTELIKESNLISSLMKLGNTVIRDQKTTFEVYRKGNGFGYRPALDSFGHFSQVNHFGNLKLHEIVKSYAFSSVCETVTELYAGSGNFTFLIQEKFKKIDAVELDEQLVRTGVNQAQKKKLDQVITFHQSSCEHWVRKQKNLSELVIMDPPRSGAKDVVKLANWNLTKDIIYISCDLASFARDLSMLNEKGFELKKLYFVDMFPRTSHVELVGIISVKK